MEGTNHTSLVVMTASNPTYKEEDLYFDVVLQDPAPMGSKTLPATLNRALPPPLSNTPDPGWAPVHLEIKTTTRELRVYSVVVM
jgi:hypothetical protein